MSNRPNIQNDPSIQNKHGPKLDVTSLPEHGLLPDAVQKDGKSEGADQETPQNSAGGLMSDSSESPLTRAPEE